MMWGYGWEMGWMWLFVPLSLIAIMLIVLIVRLFTGGISRNVGSGTPEPLPGRSRPRQILEERFAKGELSADQYREQIQVLNEDR